MKLSYEEEMRLAEPILIQTIMECRHQLELAQCSPTVMCEALVIGGCSLLGSTCRAYGLGEATCQELFMLLVQRGQAVFEDAMKTYSRLAYQEQLNETRH